MPSQAGSLRSQCSVRVRNLRTGPGPPRPLHCPAARVLHSLHLEVAPGQWIGCPLLPVSLTHQLPRLGCRQAVLVGDPVPGSFSCEKEPSAFCFSSVKRSGSALTLKHGKRRWWSCDSYSVTNELEHSVEHWGLWITLAAQGQLAFEVKSRIKPHPKPDKSSKEQEDQCPCFLQDSREHPRWSVPLVLSSPLWPNKNLSHVLESGKFKSIINITWSAVWKWGRIIAKIWN